MTTSPSNYVGDGGAGGAGGTLSSRRTGSVASLASIKSTASTTSIASKVSRMSSISTSGLANQQQRNSNGKVSDGSSPGVYRRVADSGGGGEIIKVVMFVDGTDEVLGPGIPLGSGGEKTVSSAGSVAMVGSNGTKTPSRSRLSSKNSVNSDVSTLWGGKQAQGDVQTVGLEQKSGQNDEAFTVPDGALVIEFGMSPLHLGAVMGSTAIQTRKLWDCIFDDTDVIERFDEDTSLFHLKMKKAAFLARTPDRFISISTSIPSTSDDAPPSMRPAPPYVRGHIDLLAWSIEVVPASPDSDSDLEPASATPQVFSSMDSAMSPPAPPPHPRAPQPALAPPPTMSKALPVTTENVSRSPSTPN
ncbi:hypothetical protein HK102_008775 [Quaeritorhiza haematococci]|nr:hypothetical protein HK102_008775 [Quaeritorhiza haematococci]